VAEVCGVKVHGRVLSGIWPGIG